MRRRNETVWQISERQYKRERLLKMLFLLLAVLIALYLTAFCAKSAHVTLTCLDAGFANKRVDILLRGHCIGVFHGSEFVIPESMIRESAQQPQTPTGTRG